ncbi:reverse transcriptase domain-containing protein, partial [Tanacetum coccineum]
MSCDIVETVSTVVRSGTSGEFSVAGTTGIVTVVGWYGLSKMHFLKASPFGLVSMYLKKRDRHCAYRLVASIGGRSLEPAAIMWQNAVKNLRHNAVKCLRQNAVKSLRQNAVKSLRQNAVKNLRQNTVKSLRQNAVKSLRQNAVKNLRQNAVKSLRQNAVKSLRQNAVKRTPIKRRGLKERLGPRHVHSRFRSPEPRRDRSKSPKKTSPERKVVFKKLEKGVFQRLGDKGKSVSVHSDDSRCWSHHSSHKDTESCYQNSRSRATESASERRYTKRASSRRTEELSESESSAGGHWKSKLKRKKSSIKDDLSQPWVCEETDPFTPRIRYFDFPKTRMPSHIKTYDGSEDPEDHLKIFQSAAKTERWAMPTWCHMFNSTLTGNDKVWFDDLPKETIDSYDDLKKAFLENYLQQKKCIKDPVEIYNIRQRDGESTKEFMR